MLPISLHSPPPSTRALKVIAGRFRVCRISYPLVETSRKDSFCQRSTCSLHCEALMLDQPGNRLLNRLKRGIAWLIAK